jgi:CRISPR system Cascade subunit CasA
VTNKAGFNLLDEPWILTLDKNGQEDPLSILDVFERAQDLRRIGGEVPTQGFAITRLLLAFLHRALKGPRNRQEWLELWQADNLPMGKIRKYAGEVRGRFDLFHPTQPFFQVPGLRTGKAEPDGVKKIIADVPDGEPLFTTRSPGNLTRIEPAEAARWLVHVHAYDTAGIKSGAVGDPLAKDGKGYGSSLGWSGQLGGVLPEGRTLRDTLVLNLIAYEHAPNGFEIGYEEDLPPWDRDADTHEWSTRSPEGAVDVYTWQTRRVRLIGDRDGVTGVVLCKGDRIEPQNRQVVEPHTAWRYSEPQTKKHKQKTYMPLMHAPERSIWRGLEAMLPSVMRTLKSSTAGEPDPRLAPRIMDWLDQLTRYRHIPADYPIQMWAVGVSYGPKNTSYEEIVNDRLTLQVALLRTDRPALGKLADGAVKEAKKTADAVSRLARNIADAAGSGESKGFGERAAEQLYAVLDQPYRLWLADLGPDTKQSKFRAEWQRTVLREASRIADELVVSAPPAAWVGREVNKRLVNVARAELWFITELRNVLPSAFTRKEPVLTEAAS